MHRFSITSLRSRLILLVLLAIVPALALLLYIVADTDRILPRHVLGVILVVLIAIVAAWLGGELLIFGKIKSLLRVTQRLAGGDLSARTGIPYDEGELSELARSFDQMAAALKQREEERLRAGEEILRHNRDLAALNTITAAISSSLELPEILESLKKLLAEKLNVPAGALFFYDESDDSLTVEVAWGLSSDVLVNFQKFPASTSPYDQVVRGKQVVLKPELCQITPYSMPFSTSAGLQTWQSYMCLPLLAKGEVQGVLDLFSLSPNEFVQDQVTLFTTLGQQVGVAIQNARLFEQIRAGRQRLYMLSQQLLEVQESERRHIARELHDEIGQALTAVKVNLQSAQRLNHDALIDPHIQESIGIVERTLQQVRDLSLDLRPSLLDDLGIVAALRWYINRQARRAGFEAELVQDIGDMRLQSDLETTCFRVVQEAITNVVRHAQAQHVRVELRGFEDSLELIIRDDGVGFDVDAVIERAAGDLSLGLLGMHERVQLTGGRIDIQSDPKQGTEIHACFPLQKQKPETVKGNSGETENEIHPHFIGR